MKPTWSKKFNGPGTNGGPSKPKILVGGEDANNEFECIPMCKISPDQINAQTAMMKIIDGIEGMAPVTYNSKELVPIPVDKSIFDDAAPDMIDYITRSVEIFGNGPERSRDRGAWIVAMTNMKRLCVKKHAYQGHTMIVVTPLILK